MNIQHLGKCVSLRPHAWMQRMQKMQSTHYIWKKGFLKLHTADRRAKYLLFIVMWYWALPVISFICRSNKIVQEHFLGRFA